MSNIIVGVASSIAAYKVVDLVKELKKDNKLVVIMTQNASNIIKPGEFKRLGVDVAIKTFKEGFDYIVYINTAEEYDGSNSGARVEEAITWGKVKSKAPNVKIHCDATIAFPLLVAGAFTEDSDN